MRGGGVGGLGEHGGHGWCLGVVRGRGRDVFVFPDESSKGVNQDVQKQSYNSDMGVRLRGGPPSQPDAKARSRAVGAILYPNYAPRFSQGFFLFGVSEL